MAGLSVQPLNNQQTITSVGVAQPSGTLTMGSGAGTLGTNTYNPQGSTYNPQQTAGSNLTTAATSGTGGATNNTAAPVYVPTAAEIQAAKDAKERASLRGATREEIARANALYDAIFGDIDALGAERLGALEGDYNTRNQRLTADYLESLPGIENNYAAIGNDSSTYKGRALGKAETGYKTGQEELGKAKGEDIAKVGSFVATNRAKYAADKNSMNALVDRMGEVEDLGSLRESRNQVEAKTRALGADRAGFMTDTGLKGTLAGLTNSGSRFEGIAQAAKNIYGSAATVSMKNAALTSLVTNSGLSPDEQKLILTNYTAAPTTTPVEEEQAQQTVTA